MTRTASERGHTHWVTPRCGCHLPQTGGWVLGHLWAVSPPRAALASLGAGQPPAQPQDAAPPATALCPSCPPGSHCDLAPEGQAPGAGLVGFGLTFSHYGISSAKGPSSLSQASTFHHRSPLLSQESHFCLSGGASPLPSQPLGLTPTFLCGTWV